jgi:allantoicase
VLTCSDMFFGERRNLIMPDRAINMSDGWETRRRRGPGHDWCIVALGARATLTRLLIDTNHFKGNYPDTCAVEVCDAPGATIEALMSEETQWRTLLEKTKLQAHTRHYFENELQTTRSATHLKLSVYPDGGVSRLRAYGVIDQDTRMGLGVRRFDTLPPRMAEAAIRQCCGSSSWVKSMMNARPFGSAQAVFTHADIAWNACGKSDWLEAFEAHPRIGESKAAPTQSAAAAAWSRQEQAGVNVATEDVRTALAEINRAYEKRFGFIYIVCATGRTAEDMLAYAQTRINNTRDAELCNAAAEQHKITRLRLEKLLEP